MNDLQNKFTNFVKELSNSELLGMCESRTNIKFEGGEFYLSPRCYKDDRGGTTIYDSDGQADYPISTQEMMGQLIDDAECLLESVMLSD